MKCSDCGAYFPVAGDATIRRPETDPVDLHIPFRPSELDDPAEQLALEGADQPFPFSPGSKPSRGACPACGSRAVRPSNPGGEEPLTRRLDARTTYRCARCNGSFRRIDPLRLLVFSMVLLGLLAGLSYLAISMLGVRGPGDPSPRIRKDQIKPPPPPVFR